MNSHQRRKSRRSIARQIGPRDTTIQNGAMKGRFIRVEHIRTVVVRRLTKKAELARWNVFDICVPT